MEMFAKLMFFPYMSEKVFLFSNRNFRTRTHRARNVRPSHGDKAGHMVDERAAGGKKESKGEKSQNIDMKRQIDS